MKVIAMNTPQTKALRTKELSRNTVSAYKAIREQFRAMISGTPHVADYCEQNLLDPNMGPEIRRIRW